MAQGSPECFQSNRTLNRRFPNQPSVVTPASPPATVKSRLGREFSRSKTGRTTNAKRGLWACSGCRDRIKGGLAPSGRDAKGSFLRTSLRRRHGPLREVHCNRPSQSAIASHQRGAQLPGQYDIGRVVRREVFAQTQDPLQQVEVSVARQGQIPIVGKNFLGPFAIQSRLKQRTAQSGAHLNIAQRRNMQIRIRSGDQTLNRQARARTQQILNHRRGVQDRRFQPPLRSSRSWRISAAAPIPRSTGRRRRIRWKTSSRGGRATSRSRIF